MKTKIKLGQREILPALSAIVGIVERRQNMPILYNLLVRVEADEVTLTATDLETEISMRLPCETSGAGEYTLPARKFYDIVRALPDDARIEVSWDQNKAHIKSGKGKYNLSTLPAADYPPFDNGSLVHEIQIEQRVLKNLLHKTAFCMALDDVRYYLKGLLLDIRDDRVIAVTTDGHRLAYSEHAAVTAREGIQVIIPRKAVTELGKILGDTEEEVRLGLSKNSIKASFNGVTLSAKLIDGKFPNYATVIPQQSRHVLTLEREPLRDMLGRAKILANETHKGIRLQLDENRLVISAQNPDNDDVQEEMDIEFTDTGFEIGFNVNYLQDALNSISTDTVRLCLTDPNSSCVVRPLSDDSTLYVVMPLRI